MLGKLLCGIRKGIKWWCYSEVEATYSGRTEVLEGRITCRVVKSASRCLYSGVEVDDFFRGALTQTSRFCL